MQCLTIDTSGRLSWTHCHANMYKGLLVITV